MRLRLQAESPLPVLKAWFAFDDNETIRNLKNAICTTVPALKDAKTKPETTTLELDGFELLDDLTFGGIVKDGDLVVIKQKEAGTSAKRKAESSASKPSKKAKYAHVSSSSESSTSESESSDDSDSSSDDSDSSSSSGSSAAPHAAPIRRKPVKASTNNVPPGHGTHQTQNRNQRRRLKKQYDRSGVSMSTPPAPPKKTSAANAQPLGQEDEDLSLSMFSLGNKNKKKGYKQTLTRPTASKIVFEPKEDEPVPQPQPKPTPSRSNSTYERLVPPSERTDIPKNMFVSSVDVEADLRPKKNTKKRQPPAQVWAEEEVVEEQMLLDYGDPAESSLWQDIENTFDNLDAAPPALDESHVGGLLAWKELTLNAISFSPEIMLQLARIVTVSPTSCTIQKIVRPGWEEDEVQSTEDLPLASLTSSQMKYVKPST